MASYPGAVLAPPIPYGSSGEHAAFPGTLSIGQDALEAVLVELVRSSHFVRTLIVNGHGGNQRPLARAVDTLQGEGRDVLSWSPVISGGDAHAGRIETSLFLAAFPDRVGDLTAANGNPAPLDELMPALQRGRLREVAPSGVLGDPSLATAAEGAVLWATLTADLLAAAAAYWAPAVAR